MAQLKYWNGSAWVNAVIGAQGVVGSQGTQGVIGLQGTQGLQGPQGLQGLQGTQGPQGTQGIQGAQGTQGLQGTTGSTGSQGAQGTTGIQGAQGTQGLQGTTGSTGSQGAQGVQGNDGIQGLLGTQGLQGLQGTIGLQGNTGTGLSVTTFTLNTNVATTVDTVAIAGFTTMEYILSIVQGTKVRSSKILVHENGSAVDFTEYGIISTGGTMNGILVNVSLSGSNSILQITITDAATTNATVKFTKVVI